MLTPLQADGIVSPVAQSPRERKPMPADVLKPVKSLGAQKTAVAKRERELIENLNRVLPGMGYRVVPNAAGSQAQRLPSRSGRAAGKPLRCPRCARTFAHPLHLGRHMSAIHGTKRAKGKKKGS
jgi:uncharacterized C2H2 Zn-finger protein